MSISTTPDRWQDTKEYNYPLDQVIAMAQEATAAIKGSLQASYNNTIKDNPAYSEEYKRKLEMLIFTGLPAHVQGFDIFLNLISKADAILEVQKEIRT